jgi:hypothetical protein
MVELVGKAHWTTQLRDLAGEVGKQGGGVRLAEHRGNGADQHRCRAESLDFEAEVGEVRRGAFEPVAIGLLDLDDFRDEQSLSGDRAAIARRARTGGGAGEVDDQREL